MIKKILVVLRTISIIIITILAALIYIPSILGITPVIDLLGTMEPSIKKGSLSYINKKYNYEDLKEKDIIEINLYNQKNTVRIKSINKEDNTISVKGDAESAESTIVITKKEYIGKHIFSISKIGIFILIVQRNFYITIVLIIIIIISLIRDYLKYKNIDITRKIPIINNIDSEKKIEKQVPKTLTPKETTIEKINIDNDEEIEELLETREIRLLNKEENTSNKEEKNNKHEKKTKLFDKTDTIEILNDDEVKEILEILDNNDKSNKENVKPEILYTIDDEEDK